MAIHNDIGNDGEAIAVAFLKEEGYTILETNWQYRRAEVDIIAMDEKYNILVFFEVKTRTSDQYGNPESFITRQKERLLADAAGIYMDEIQHEWEVRFDYIGIRLLGPDRNFIEHFEDVFFPGY